MSLSNMNNKLPWSYPLNNNIQNLKYKIIDNEVSNESIAVLEMIRINHLLDAILSMSNYMLKNNINMLLNFIEFEIVEDEDGIHTFIRIEGCNNEVIKYLSNITYELEDEKLPSFTLYYNNIKFKYMKGKSLSINIK